MSRNPGRDRTQSRQPRTPPQPPPARTPSPRRTTEPPQSSSYRRGTTPPWREHERGRDDLRQRFETPPTRSTRSRTENRSNQGASWTNTGRQARRDVPNVPEPPAPPRRQTGAQWLNSGAWQNVPEPPQMHRNTGRGYFQPPYYRQNPNTSAVEYMPGYQAPYERWIRRPDGTWLDLVPQTLDQSIYFNQPRWQHRDTELWLYGYTFTMGL